MLLRGNVTPADVQDRDGGLALLATLLGLFPFLKRLFADSAYEGPIFETGLATILPELKTEIVKRSNQVKGFVVLPRRWIVERTIAWLNRCRRLAKDWENLNRTALALIAEQERDPFRVLVACILSLRTQDTTTGPAAARLFAPLLDDTDITDDRQGRTLFGIGRRAEFIEQDKRVGSRDRGDAVEVDDMRGKGREVLLNRLRVANVGKEFVK